MYHHNPGLFSQLNCAEILNVIVFFVCQVDTGPVSNVYLRNLASQTEYTVSVFALYDGVQSEALKGVFTTSKDSSFKVRTQCNTKNEFAL